MSLGFMLKGGEGKNWPGGLGKEKVVKADEFVRLGCIFLFCGLFRSRIFSLFKKRNGFF